MTITTRSKRVSAFGNAHTPAAVGPGSYATEALGSNFKSASRPHFSGFVTSEKRNLNENKTTSAMTPGRVNKCRTEVIAGGVLIGTM